MTKLKLIEPALLRVYDNEGNVLVEMRKHFHGEDRYERSEAQRRALTRLFTAGAVQATSHDNGVVYTFAFRDGQCIVPTLRSLEGGW